MSSYVHIVPLMRGKVVSLTSKGVSWCCVEELPTVSGVAWLPAYHDIYITFRLDLCLGQAGSADKYTPTCVAKVFLDRQAMDSSLMNTAGSRAQGDQARHSIHQPY